MKIDNKLIQEINKAVNKGINNALTEAYVNEGWKHAALGAMMGTSLIGGLQSCSNINDPEQTYNYKSTADHWMYEHLIGTEFDAGVLELNNKNKKLIELQIDHIQYTNYFGDGAPAFVWYDGEYVKELSGKINDNYVVDYYCIYRMGEHNHYLPDEIVYIAIHYDKDERKSMSDRIQYITVFHTFEDRESTEFYLNVDKIKNSGNRNYWRIYD